MPNCCFALFGVRFALGMLLAAFRLRFVCAFKECFWRLSGCVVVVALVCVCFASFQEDSLWVAFFEGTSFLLYFEVMFICWFVCCYGVLVEVYFVP